MFKVRHISSDGGHAYYLSELVSSQRLLKVKTEWGTVFSCPNGKMSRSYIKQLIITCLELVILAVSMQYTS